MWSSAAICGCYKASKDTRLLVFTKNFHYVCEVLSEVCAIGVQLLEFAFLCLGTQHLNQGSHACLNIKFRRRFSDFPGPVP